MMSKTLVHWEKISTYTCTQLWSVKRNINHKMLSSKEENSSNILCASEQAANPTICPATETCRTVLLVVQLVDTNLSSEQTRKTWPIIQSALIQYKVARVHRMHTRSIDCRFKEIRVVAVLPKLNNQIVQLTLHAGHPSHYSVIQNLVEEN